MVNVASMGMSELCLCSTSLKTMKYYVRYSEDPQKKDIEHNTNPHNTFTSKHRPWILKAYFPVSEKRGEAMKVEKYIKSLKSKKIIEEIILRHNESDFINTFFKKVLLV